MLREERLQALARLYASGPFGHLTCDARGSLLDVNAAGARLIGLSRSRLIGRRLQEFLAPECRGKFRTALSEGGRASSTRPCELVVLRPDGRRRDVSFHGGPVGGAGRGRRLIAAVVMDITRHKHGEVVLRHARDFAETLIRTASVMIISLDREGRIQVFNEAAEAITGYTRAELEGSNWFETLVPKERYPQVWAEFHRLLAGGLPRTFENPIVTRSGEERIISWRNNEIREGGRVAGTISFGVDITDSLRLEQRLQAQEHDYRLLAEYSNDIICRIGPDTVFTFVSPAAMPVLGYDPEELVGQSIRQLVHPEDRDPARGEFWRQIGPEGTYRTLFRARARDGSYRWIEASGRAVGARRGGAFEELVTVMRDVTERVQVQAALAESERNHRLLSEHSNDMICRIGPDGVMTFVSPACQSLLGFTPEELTGRPIQELVHPEDLSGVTREFWSQAHAQGSYRVEHRMRTRDGAWKWVESSGRVIDPTAEQTFGELVTSIRDIGARVQAEEALRQVSGRLLQLQEEEQRRIGRELHDSTGQNMAALAMKLSELDAALPLDAGAAREALQDASRLTGQCIRELRTYSYLLHPPLLEELGLEGALRDYLDGFQRRTGILCQTEFDPLPAHLSRDIEVTLFRVVQEALLNIHLHSGSRTAKIRLGCHEGALKLEISDSGRGIPKEVLRGAEAGHGLLGVGITGMRARMRQLGGQLAIRSSPRGTTIRAQLNL